MARERYLRGMKDEPAFQREQKEMTPAEKRRNWWYYHKLMILGAVVLLAILVSIFWSIFGKTKPDYTIALTTSFDMPEAGIYELERCISEYADDRNGDGKVKVTVQNYVFPGQGPTSPDDADRQIVSMSKFVADFVTNDSMILLYDETALLILETDLEGLFLYNDGSNMPDGASDFENAWTEWKDCKAFASFTPVLDDDLSFDSETMQVLYNRLRMSIRKAEDTSIERDEKSLAYHADSLELYHRLISGEKAKPTAKPTAEPATESAPEGDGAD